ncbi:hypothetical protein LSH36_1492g00003 [Paralvinella palmiformis]|uniref:Uncharacterized protein n=1 Tax=Paralvinella palmiformis TaxID=53620 RepID=A0AAD9IU13_9ANNE|nr:hypothetical protein LSH36_1492g00003 [Paralvinella palmiformis]
MFFTVRYGNNNREIFNANCRNVLLLQHIKEKCNCSETETVDISDEYGVVKNLHQHLLDYASEFVQDRENVVLVRVVRGTEDGIHYVPLLLGKDRDKDFLAKLNPKEPKWRAQRRDSGDATGRSGRVVSRRGSLTVPGRRGSVSGRNHRLSNTSPQKK